jgi:metal-dependent amidase/aminoacylase/carboxypeptidase family protein
VITWRRNFHQNPELENREFKTAEKLQHLRSLGIEVRHRQVAKTRCRYLRGGENQDRLLLLEKRLMLYRLKASRYSFASKQKGSIMAEACHACYGHDTHITMLMGTAEILASLKVS